MAQVVAILEGTATDVDRGIDEGIFRLVQTRPDRVGAQAAAGRARPFTLFVEADAEGPDMPANVSGDYVLGSEFLKLTVLYSHRPNNMHDLHETIAGDTYLIRRALGWPLAWAEVNGWCGTEIMDRGFDDFGPGETQDLLGNQYTIRIDYREDWG